MMLTKHSPVAVLSLTLGLAIAVLVIGSRMAREERTVTIVEDRSSLTAFTTQLLGALDELEQLYESHLVNLSDALSQNPSTIEISAACRNLEGIEQATLFKKNSLPTVLDLRETDRSTPLPHPRRLGSDDRGTGPMITTDYWEKKPLAEGHFWENTPGHPPHFVARLPNRTVLLLRINPKHTAAAIDTWLSRWVKENFAPVQASGITAALKSPRGNLITEAGEVTPSTEPSFLLPLPTRYGTWGVLAWDRTETVVTHRQPVIVGATTIATLLSLAAIFGYGQQRRALWVAEQRVSFVNRVSHELRTPLTNIQLNIDLVADALFDEDGPAAKRLSLVRDETSRLNRLLENVLTFSRNEKAHSTGSDNKQSLRLVPCEIETTLDEVFKQFAPSLERLNLIIERERSSPPLVVLADPDALSQIISNLVSNVEKYATDGERFQISAEPSPDSRQVHLSVRDYGPGVLPVDAEHIFRPFARLKNATTEVTGTGLGLSIARDLAEAMDGKLVLLPSEQGAHFQLTLPRAPEKIAAIPS